MDPRALLIKEYDYLLPEEAIAAYPLAERDASKLLIYQKGKISEDIFRNIASHIPAHSLLVFNDTKVIEARLLFQKPTGGIVEIFCLSPHEQYPDISVAMRQQGKVWWQCLVGGASKWKRGMVLEKLISTDTINIRLQAIFIEKKPDHFIVELSWSPPQLSFAEVLHRAGVIPLPPYIKRPVEDADAKRYQTIYAHMDGSVAAPTAGLHFTYPVFERLQTKNIKKDFITLHVGASTFKPIKSESLGAHDMHSETIVISRTTIENILYHLDKNIVAVGTTSFRSIESLYWLGLKAGLASEKRMGKDQSDQVTGPGLEQWDAYEPREKDLSPRDSLLALLEWMKKNEHENLVTNTKLLVAPGYKPRIANALITNFHQPQSTLLVLVAALIEAGWKEVYNYALRHGFRFLSYGDGSLLWFAEN